MTKQRKTITQWRQNRTRGAIRCWGTLHRGRYVSCCHCGTHLACVVDFCVWLSLSRLSFFTIFLLIFLFFPSCLTKSWSLRTSCVESMIASWPTQSPTLVSCDWERLWNVVVLVSNLVISFRCRSRRGCLVVAGDVSSSNVAHPLRRGHRSLLRSQGLWVAAQQCTRLRQMSQK